ncbi:MAG: GbsR/MarR family transcriptional regulator, partial [Candidatus Limnocylindrales bacterium]
MTASPPPATEPARPASSAAEKIRLAFAEAWGEMGPAWGVQPSLARVHGYFLASGEPLTERDVRVALGLSHRAASIAVAECEAWGLVERVADQLRSGRRGPSATAYAAVGDYWVWFQRVAEQRKARETDPILPRIQACLGSAERVAAADPADPEVARLRDWLMDLAGFLQLFDRAVGLIARAETAEIARGFAVLARLPDESLDRLLRLLGSLPEEELASTLDAISRVSPAVARGVLTAAGRVARLG